MNAGPNREASEMAALAQGINVNMVSKFNIAPGFDWIEAPLMPSVGYIFPTEATYHPLIVSNNYEIATNLFSIEGSGLPEEEKAKYRAKVESLVKLGPRLSTIFAVNTATLIILIIGAIIILLARSKTFPIIGTIIAVAVCLVTGHVFLGPMNDAAGRARWNDFVGMLNSRLSSGATPAAILKQLAEDDRVDKAAIQQKYNNAGMGSNTSLVSSALGSFMGVAFGNRLKK